MSKKHYEDENLNASQEQNSWFGRIGSFLINNQNKKKCSTIAFANESQYLLVSQSSIDYLKSKIKNSSDITYENFRPNLVVQGSEPFQEDHWDIISIGNQLFKLSGPCNRCAMTCIDKKTLTIGSEPLRTLSEFRKAEKGKILFGILFEHSTQEEGKMHYLSTEMPIKVIKHVSQ